MGKEVEKVSKESWLEEFADQRPDYFFPEAWTEEQKQEATEILKPARLKSAMFAAIPMTCQGKKCPVAAVCPLLAKNLAPVGKPCPIELDQVREAMVSLMEDLNVHQDNLVEVSMVRDLVDQEIQYLRTQKKLGLEDFIQDAVIGISESTGEPIYKKELHLAVELQDRIHKRRKDLRNQLMATREQKAKVGQGRIDSAQAISDIFSQLREVEIKQNELIRKKLGTAGQDEYIEQIRRREQDIQDAEIIDVEPDDE